VSDIPGTAPTPDPATDYARRVDPAGFSWSALEGAAFRGHPPVAQALARSSAERAEAPASGSGWGRLLAGLPAFVVLLAPVLAPGVIIAFGRGADARVGAIVVAGVLAVAHVLLRVGEWVRLGRGIPVGTPREALLAAISVPFGLLATVLAGMVAAAAASPAAPAAWASVAALAAMTASCVVAVPVLRRAAKRGLALPRTAAAEAQAAVDSLDRSDRAAVTADVASALALLAERGVISDVERDRALRAPLAGLERHARSTEGAPHRA
jgi:hypothetical protein